MEEGPSAKFYAAVVSLDGGYDAQFERTPGRLSLRKKIEAQMQVETSCGRKQNQSRQSPTKWYFKLIQLILLMILTRRLIQTIWTHPQLPLLITNKISALARE
ncbi:hypothetical protein DY000_02033443 [Brassica cretica]|uniref:Uncharacterized protein n=1 Tax=Brassica cretica TaxID=69181 RepID=A0ABQ7DIB9_BRACR|nr:hypothetical protein DY000_02033443 [Brassica cretica]